MFFLPACLSAVNCLFLGHDPTNLPLAIINQENNCSNQSFRESCEADMMGC